MKKLLLFSFMVFCLFLIPTGVYAINEVNIYFFYSEGCSICSQEKVYLEALKERYPNMRVYSYNADETEGNNLMLEAKEMYNNTNSGVPFTVIGDTAYLGFSQSRKAQFQRRVYEYSTKAYENKLGEKLGISYRNDLEGEVEEYTDNSNYQIEETSGNTHTTTTTNEKDNLKYRSSFILISAGVVLAFIVFIISRLEKRGRL